MLAPHFLPLITCSHHFPQMEQLCCFLGGILPKFFYASISNFNYMVSSSPLYIKRSILHVEPHPLSGHLYPSLGQTSPDFGFIPLSDFPGLSRHQLLQVQSYGPIVKIGKMYVKVNFFYQYKQYRSHLNMPVLCMDPLR